MSYTIHRGVVLASALLLAAGLASAQTRQSGNQTTRIQGKTEIDAVTQGMTAVASGENSAAVNRVGVVKGSKTGDTKISVKTGNVTTIVGGRNKKACTNIGGIVSDECK